MDKKKIGSELKRWRKTRGMTQVELGEKLGVSKNMISIWESGRQVPHIYNTLPKICSALNIDYDIVFRDLSE